MRKPLAAMLVILLAALAGAQDHEPPDVTEAITPASARLFVKTARIRRLVATARYALDNLLGAEESGKVLKTRDEIKAKTGIDFLNLESLKGTGIDIARTLSLAYFGKGGDGQERMVVFIPVLNEKTFPLKFVEILKRARPGVDVDVFPVITPYKDFRIYQIRKDVFCTSIDGVFAVASTGELIQSVIDTKISQTGFLAADPSYCDYQAGMRGSFDVQAYLNRDMLKEVIQSAPRRPRPGPEEMKTEPEPQALNSARLMPVDYRMVDGEATAPRTDQPVGPSMMNNIDYGAVAVGLNQGRLALRLGARLGTGTPQAAALLGVLKTGATARALVSKDAVAYTFLSLDLNRVEELCRDRAAWCAYYDRFKTMVREAAGIDVAADLLPVWNGSLTVLVGPSKDLGSGGNYVLYLPLASADAASAVWKKSRQALEARLKAANGFGGLKIGGREAFWFIDNRNRKNMAVRDQRGFYLGNDQALMETALKSRELAEAPESSALRKRLDDSVFMYSFARKESFVNALIAMQSMRVKPAAGLVSRIGDIALWGSRVDRFISLTLDVEILNKK